MPRTIKIESGDDLPGAVSDAVESLRSGHLIGIPDSTSYVLAAHADDAVAVKRLRELVGEPLRVALRDETTRQLRRSLPQRLSALTGRCWPGPLVVQVEKPSDLSLTDDASAAASAAGLLQMIAPSGEVIRILLDAIESPLVLGSSGRVGSAEDLVSQSGDQLDLVVDDGPPIFESPATVVRCVGADIDVVFSGILSEQAINISACQIYLFVCTGNTCRSPLAEGLFRKLLADRLECAPGELVRHGYLVQSAGLAAASGGSASFESVELLRRRDIDINSHSSQPVSETLLNASNHIYTMTAGHRDAIIRYQADLANKVEVLRRDGSDVVDPIGGGIGEYERCEREIEESLRAIIASHFG